MMQLFALGFTPGTEHKPSNAPFLCALSVKVLWSSWCDAVIAHTDGVTSAMLYNGTGLRAGQSAHLSNDEELKRAVNGDRRHTIFFGSSMQDGLRGYVLTDETEQGVGQRIVLFATDLEMEHGIPEIQICSTNKDAPVITDIRILNDASLVLSAIARSTNEEINASMQNFSQLRIQLPSPSTWPSHQMMHPPCNSHDRPQCVINATTTTIVDIYMHVWTATRDPRYPKCLGRPYEGSPDFAPVPYLSETTITKIVSGGYMSAALSSEGELFLWGQACPGSQGELRVLSGNGAEREFPNGISVEGEQDEFVKCLEVWIEGQAARVYDVAIGHGHILVAAELAGSGRKKKRIVYGAGDNSRNQLGLGAEKNFLDTFEEVVALRGKQVAQLVAAGWSSFVVLLDQ
ncbi:hypothetical protein P3342_005264 [Pyrenophora teres f. teres]|uniref:Uncharacterized protein n=2 Tax=Pyrenophora teres f. teres TaxID=97479 RepID=E3RF77_PYRTT|nr:hypothetical protein PTT_05763 [Pyrenophora teres f. teres 0-1]KAE8846200.1 hypothetical protein HRS9139_00767 [Pyrenophora teres f. teres]CAA9959888.1 hypothetical protein PTMSG1_03296 [Pyrenophora teres f. maculata]KAE8848340.1 hypothetical protein PTNB85_02183 [Pyrenophora teres f. teres]KAE8853493.1 hypothetical protein HRS9122_00485 [Pyrenophora teres f. teres]